MDWIHPQDLDAPERFEQLRKTIQKKPALKLLYNEIYHLFKESAQSIPASVEGPMIELGSGAGHIREVIPEMVTTDTTPYPHIDHVVDACKMPFAKDSVKFLCMLNVFHHIPDVEKFLKEVSRVLMVGGKLCLFDQHHGFPSRLIFQHLHHEDYYPKAKKWAFHSQGPLSSANGALTWIVFRRDLEKFQKLFPKLKLKTYRPQTPLRYWLAGGLKSWSLLPKGLFPLASFQDKALSKLFPWTGSFVLVEIEKVS